MIYLLGDVHGDKDRFKRSAFRKFKIKPPGKGDTVIICGDFGFIWNGTEKEKKALTWLGNRSYSVLFIAGTHENFDLLGKYPSAPFAGGMARRISGKLKLLENGNIFTIEGKRIFVFGGGESDDKLFKKETETWYPQELPDQAQLDFGRKVLDQAALKVDFVLTHDAPTRIRNFIHIDNHEMNELHAFFDWILQNCSYQHWFFAKYHLDRKISPSFSVLYKRPIVLTRKPAKQKKRKGTTNEKK